MPRKASGTGEFVRIRRFTQRFARAKVPVGIGDDCAVLGVRRGHELVVTTDSIVEDVHFTRAHFSPEDIGHKALAVNVSDVVAMGAKPSWFLCALELPAWVDDEALDGIARGMALLAKACGIALVGGNFSSAQKLSITLTAMGEVPRGKARTRSGAKAGDLLYVSGTLGDARWQLAQMKKAGRAGPRQARPRPRVDLRELALKYAHACIDLSDGLTADLQHVLDASRVGAALQLDALPTSAELRQQAGEEAPKWALAGGEDYELLFCVPPRREKAFLKAARSRVTRIGYITRTRRLVIRDSLGRQVAAPGGFDHFAHTDGELTAQ